MVGSGDENDVVGLLAMTAIAVIIGMLGLPVALLVLCSVDGMQMLSVTLTRLAL